MPTKRFDKKHWKMVVVLLAICGAMLLLRWAAVSYTHLAYGLNFWHFNNFHFALLINRNKGESPCEPRPTGMIT